MMKRICNSIKVANTLKQQKTNVRKFSQKTKVLQEQQTTPAANYPGATKAPFTSELNFVNSTEKVFPVFHIMDTEGKIVNQKAFDAVKEELKPEKILKMYTDMLTLNTMDDILYNAQRQGRVSFYMTNYGEEAIQIGSAAAIDPKDHIYAQYREAGVLVYLGFTLREFMAQCFSTQEDYGKGRQMPVHYGSKRLNFQTISSPLGTQIPQAAGTGYGLRVAGDKNVCFCYFGEGAASEGDFHPALNFAATLKSQTIFICRNNGYAISTPTEDQYRGDGIVSRGLGYGIHSSRVDGNDIFASFHAVNQARKLSIEHKTPVLIEAMTYRGGHHSTSDDASRYRTAHELEYWTGKQNPIVRLRKFLNSQGLWDDDKEARLREAKRAEIRALLEEMEHAPKPDYSELVHDVYDNVPRHLQEQKEFVDEIVKKYPEAYASAH